MEVKEMGFKVREAVVRYKKVSGVIETVTSAEEVWKFFCKKVKGETREVFYCLYLSQRNGVLCFEEVSVGISTGTMIDIKGIVRTAILVGAEKLIFIHNHPSGDPEPSAGDKDITKKFVEACEVFNIEVLDHVIVGDEGFSSLKGMGDL
jgi:DNA repair protein RadC